jgi:hypothetical protein
MDIVSLLHFAVLWYSFMFIPFVLVGKPNNDQVILFTNFVFLNTYVGEEATNSE